MIPMTIGELPSNIFLHIMALHTITLKQINPTHFGKRDLLIFETISLNFMRTFIKSIILFNIENLMSYYLDRMPVSLILSSILEVINHYLHIQ